jgi:hypothetical protein
LAFSIAAEESASASTLSLPICMQVTRVAAVSATSRAWDSSRILR